MAIFETQTTVPTTPATAFEFLSQPLRLKEISPPEMGLKFIDAPPQFQLGDTFQFLVQTMGQVQTIKHRISEFDDPHLFVEELIEGPLRLWKHTHSFLAVGTDRTEVRDHIEFEPPGGLIGLLLTESRILDQLEEGFYYRHQQLQKHFC